MTKERILRYAVYAAGVVSLAVFIVTKSEVLLNSVTRDMFSNGDLYRFARVEAFKTPVPPTTCPKAPVIDGDIGNAEVIVVGDSYMETCRGHERFSVQLAESLDTDVAAVYAGRKEEYFDPFYLYWKTHLGTDRKRIVLLERIERYIMNQYSVRRDEDTATFQEIAQSAERSFLDTLRDRWFTKAEKNYGIFFSSSNLTAPVVETWNTLRFNLFGRISDETPVYSLHPPFLFFKDEVLSSKRTSYYYPHPDSLVCSIADNIAAIHDELQLRCHAELVFMPIPNAYTLYHGFVNNDPYDSFLPRLCARLEERGVRTIDLYERFRDSREILYLPTDSHWNTAGVHLAVDQAVRLLSGMRENPM